jgi:hypothetical protein
LSHRQSPFLPDVKENFIISFANIFIRFLYFLQLLIAVFYTASFVKKFAVNLKSKNQSKDKLFNTIGFLYIFIFTLIFFNRTTNAYDVSFWLTILTFLNVMTISGACSDPLFLRFSNTYMFRRLFVLMLSLFLINTLIFSNKYYYKFFKKYKNDSWVGMSVPIKYSTKDIVNNMRDDFLKNCDQYDKRTLYLFDDHTYFIFKQYSGINIAPVTYTMLPYYFNNTVNVGKSEIETFFATYSRTIFYGSCDFRSELPLTFNLRNKNNELHLCCLVR